MVDSKFMKVKVVNLKDGSEAIIRPLTKNDKDLLIEFFENIGFETVKYFHPFSFTKEKAEEIIANIEKTERFYIIGINEKNKILGIAYLDPFKPGSIARLGIGIREDYRGLGLGTFLMSFLIDSAKSRGVNKIVLEVYADNCRAIALYCKFGFEVYEIKKKARYLDWDKRRHTIYLMELELGH